MNHIDYILIQGKLRGQLMNCRTYRSTKLGSYHFLVIANMEVKPGVSRSRRKVVEMYDMDKLCDKRQGKSSR